MCIGFFSAKAEINEAVARRLLGEIKAAVADIAQSWRPPEQLHALAEATSLFSPVATTFSIEFGNGLCNAVVSSIDPPSL